MQTEYMKLIKYFAAAWIAGYIFSTDRSCHFIKIVKIPAWVNRALYIIRRNKPVNVLALVWQVLFVCMFIVIVGLHQLHIFTDIYSPTKAFGYVFLFVFLVFGILTIIDGIIYYKKR